MSNAAMQETTQSANPLTKIAIPTPFGSWEEWKSAWDEALERRDLMALHGCLYFIFRVENAYRQAVLHLLEVADGFRYSQHFSDVHAVPNRIYNHDPKYGSYSRDSWYGAQEVAKFAWRSLNQFFRDKRIWSAMLSHEDIFERVLWFFDPTKENGNLSQNPRNKYDEAATDFLRRLGKAAWFFQLIDERMIGVEGVITQETLLKARPKLVEILAEVHGLDFILTSEGILKARRGRPRSVTEMLSTEEDYQIDDATLAKLEELATEGGRVRLEERVYRGSYPARIFLAVTVAMEEDSRQTRIAEAKRKIGEGQRELGEAWLGNCPECSSAQLTYEEGGLKCPVCGYSEDLMDS